MFISSKEVRNYGLISRVFMSISIIVTSLLLFILDLPLNKIVILTTLLLTLEFLILWISGGLRKVLSGFVVILVFVFIGFLITLFSMLIGFASPPIGYSISSMFRMVVLVLSFATMVQFFTVEEIRWIMVKLGLEDISTIVTLTLSQLPLTFIQFSEAIITIKLKLGRRNLYKVVKPLIIYSIMNSLNLAEALYIHGVYKPRRPRLFNGVKDFIIIIVSVAPIVMVLVFRL
jgi:hypothetical protein